ncbi:hypothetical protein BJ928_13111 [Rhizobium sp. WW_1]|jgi:hypothetical protein|nr:hypothetical protein BJ928_13111 [Rhizobium sp. WW_1]
MKGIASVALQNLKRPGLLESRAYLHGDWHSCRRSL